MDDHFATIVKAIELGRATYSNIRKFLTYHLTSNVAELAPFVVWALSGGRFPLAIGVVQVLALDIGTDLLPALALGAEPPGRQCMVGPAPTGNLIDRNVLRRAFAVLGPVEAAMSLLAFTMVLGFGGWTYGHIPDAGLLAVASGTAFAAIVLGQVGNAFACRSEHTSVFRIGPAGNRMLLYGILVELALLLVFLLTPLKDLLGGSFPGGAGWVLALCAIPAVWCADAIDKSRCLARRRR